MSTEDNGDSPPRYDVNIEGEDLTFARQVTEAKVTRILSILLETGSDTGGIPGDVGLSEPASGARDGAATRTTSSDGQPETSIAKYMDDLGASNNPQRLAAIALYHRDILGEGRVHKDDFPKWFEKAGRSAPKNLSRDLKNAVKRDLIAESTSEADRYYPTNNAEQKISDSNG